jgi:hypothetical protein
MRQRSASKGVGVSSADATHDEKREARLVADAVAVVARRVAYHVQQRRGRHGPGATALRYEQRKK